MRVPSAKELAELIEEVRILRKLLPYFTTHSKHYGYGYADILRCVANKVTFKPLPVQWNRLAKLYKQKGHRKRQTTDLQPHTHDSTNMSRESCPLCQMHIPVERSTATTALSNGCALADALPFIDDSVVYVTSKATHLALPLEQMFPRAVALVNIDNNADITTTHSCASCRHPLNAFDHLKIDAYVVSDDTGSICYHYRCIREELASRGYDTDNDTVMRAVFESMALGRYYIVR